MLLTNIPIKQTQDDFIEVIITEQMLQEANERNKKFYNKYGNTGTNRLDKKNQRITGSLAEIAIKNTFKTLNYSEDDNVDFISNNKLTFDSKAQGCNSKPKANYVGTLYESQKNRDVDFYIFSRVNNKHDKVWIAGIIPKQEFLNTATLMPKGTINNNFTYDEPRYELEYRLLYNPRFFTPKK